MAAIFNCCQASPSPIVCDRTTKTRSSWPSDVAFSSVAASRSALFRGSLTGEAVCGLVIRNGRTFGALSKVPCGSRALGRKEYVPHRSDGVVEVRARSASERDDGYHRSKLAVFLSGGGSNFRALHESTVRNSIYGDFVVVVSDKPDCKGCDYARENSIPVLAFPKSKTAPDGLNALELVEALRKFRVDYVVLAGYLKLLPDELVKAYPRSILNIHPGLLPAFGGKGYYGMRVHEAVIKSGARFSGPTVHFVDEKYDTGPILAQRIVPVLADDCPKDLAARVLKEEHVLYSEAVAALCEDRITWREDGVPIIRKSWEESEFY